MSTYVQSGFNILFPKRIKVWRIGDEVPEWLSDVCRVRYEFGKLILDTLSTNTGGYNIFRSGQNQGIFIHVNSEKDYVAKDIDSSRYFTLTESVLGLLYKKEKEH